MSAIQAAVEHNSYFGSILIACVGDDDSDPNEQNDLDLECVTGEKAKN
jgi:hypothetical protein